MKPYLMLALVIAASLLPVAQSQYLLNDGRFSRNDPGVVALGSGTFPGPAPTPTVVPPDWTFESYPPQAAGAVASLGGIPSHTILSEGYLGSGSVSATNTVAALGWSVAPSGIDVVVGVPIQQLLYTNYVHEVRASGSSTHLLNLSTNTNPVTLHYNDLLSTNYTVGAESGLVIDHSEEPHLGSWQGWARIDSAEPIAVVVELNDAGDRSYLPALSGHDTTLLFPYLPKTFAGCTAGYRVQNCSATAPLSLLIQFRDSGGNNVFAPFAATGIPAGQPGSLDGVVGSPAVPGNAFYNSTVVSTSGQKIAGLAEVDLGGGAFYAAIPRIHADARAYCPLVLVEESGGYVSTLYVQNLQAFTITNTTFNLVGVGGNGAAASFSGVLDPIPANGTLRVPLDQVPGAAAINFVGAARLETGSPSWDIAVCVVTESDSDRFAYSALTENTMGADVAIPALADTVPDVFLTNLVQSSASTLTLEWEPVPGAAGYQLYTNQVPTALNSLAWSAVGPLQTTNRVTLLITTASKAAIRVEPR